MALLVQTLGEEQEGCPLVRVDRHTLVKRLWRARAEDGTELAVDLDSPCTDGAFLVAKSGEVFQVAQTEEEVIVVPLPEDRVVSAQLGWYLGNQHLPIEVRPTEILIENIKTLCASLDRIGIPYAFRREVFHCKIPSHRH